jgi:hypothetical protein
MSTITLEYDADSVEATKFIEFVRTLSFVREIRERRANKLTREQKRELKKEYFRPMTLEEYRADIDRATEDIKAGRTITSAELKRQMASW